MTDTELIEVMTHNLKAAIGSHRAHMAKVTDTGTMWRCGVYEETLKFIEGRRDASDPLLPKLLAVVALVPSVKTKGCFCYVGAFDGYHGTTHTPDCNAMVAALAALEANA